MCTAAVYKTKDFYFGRNLDYEFPYGEEVTITPRNYPFSFRFLGEMKHHYAMIGMAHVAENYPLYYDAVNEKGLGIAGLNFVGNAVYKEPVLRKTEERAAENKDETAEKHETEPGIKEPGITKAAEAEIDNVAQFEFPFWLLGQCTSVKEVRVLLTRINITNTPFNEKYPVSQLHWMIADREETIVVEAVADGLHVYDNPVGVLTNNPPFLQQLFRLNDYRGLSPKQPENTFAPGLELAPYSRGMGALGLPGDLSSVSRFVRAAFVRGNSLSRDSETESVSQFFHILHSVEQQRGCCDVGGGKYEITIYTSCCNADKGIYYYTTYENHQITAVDLHAEDLDSAELSRYPLTQGEQICWQNRR